MDLKDTGASELLEKNGSVVNGGKKLSCPTKTVRVRKRKLSVQSLKKLIRRNPFWLPCFGLCFVFTVVQVFQSLRKYSNPRKLSYSKSDTTSYPAVPAFTFCYLRPYDVDRVKNNGINVKDHDRFLAEIFPGMWDWGSKNSTSISNLTGLFDSATSNFSVVPFEGLRHNMTAEYHHEMEDGRCVTWKFNDDTFFQMSETEHFGFILRAPKQHRKDMNTDDVKPLNLSDDRAIQVTDVVRKDGWIVYGHDSREQWRSLSPTAISKQYLIISFDEQLIINSAMTELNVIDEPNAQCNNEADWSSIDCEMECISKQFANEFGCYGPWVKPVVGYRECSSPSDIERLFKWSLPDLRKELSSRCDKCKRRCSFREYQNEISSLVYSRSQHTSGEYVVSTLAFRFAVGKVIIMEEYWDYDMNQFLSDLGGSVGLFLGVSIMNCYKWPVMAMKFIKKRMCGVVEGNNSLRRFSRSVRGSAAVDNNE